MSTPRGGSRSNSTGTANSPRGPYGKPAEGDDVVDVVGHMFVSFASFTAKTAKRSLKMTKHAVQQVQQASSGFVPKGARDTLSKGRRKAVSIRQVFRKTHNRELGQVDTVESETDSEEEEGNAAAAEKELDLDALFETVLANVERKFFEDDYDASVSELTEMPANYAATTPAAAFEEMATLDSLVKDRQQSLKVVDNLLKKRILAHYAVFLQGVCQISGINTDLRKIVVDCRRSRALINDSKRVNGGKALTMVQGKRRKDNLLVVKDILMAMEDVQYRHQTFHKHLKNGRFREAIQMTQWNREVQNEHLLARVAAAQGLLQEWQDYCTDPVTIMLAIEGMMEETLVRNWSPEQYWKVLDAYLLLGDKTTATDKIIMCLWHIAEGLIRKTLTEASMNQSQGTEGELTPSELLAHLASGVSVHSVIHTVCKLGERLLNFAHVFQSVLHCHTSAVKATSHHKKRHSVSNIQSNGKKGTTSPSRSPSDPALHPGNREGTELLFSLGSGESLQAFHEEMVKLLQSLGKRIAVTVHQQVMDTLRGVPFEPMDLVKGLHFFSVVILIVEATALFGCSSEDMAAARAFVKQVAMNVVNESYHAKRGLEIVRRMGEEDWKVDPDIVPEMFKVVAPISAGGYRAEVKKVKNFVTKYDAANPNPFMSEAMLIPHDIGTSIEVLGFEAVPNRAVVTSTTAIIANKIFEYVCRIAVRFPPLAHEVLQWSEELVALYLYSTAANFVSTKRHLSFAEQSDFLPATKQMMQTLRDMSLRCAQHLSGSSGELASPAHTFPPAIYYGIQQQYAAPEYYYATPQRLTAIEAVFPLIDVLKCALDSVSPLLIASLKSQQEEFLTELRACADDVLHVGLYRLASACYNFDRWVDEISSWKFESRRESRSPSKYAVQMAEEVKRWTRHCNIKFPSTYIEDQYWVHYALVLSRSLTRAYARVRRVTDIQAKQMRVDYVHIMGKMKDGIPFTNPSLMPSSRRGQELLEAYFLDHEGRESFIKQNHEHYTRAELVGWLAETSHRQRQLEDTLDYLKHEDIVPCISYDEPPASPDNESDS